MLEIQVDESGIGSASFVLFRSHLFLLHFTDSPLPDPLQLYSYPRRYPPSQNREGDPPQRNSEDLFDERRSVPVLPIFVLPSLSSRTFSLSTGATRDRRTARDS